MNNLQRLVKDVLARGATAAEAIRIFIETREAAFENNALKSAQADRMEEWGLRVICGKKQSSVSTNDPDRLSDAVEEAMRLAQAAEDDPYAGLPDPEPIEAVPDICDSRQVTLAEVLDAATALVDAARSADSRVSVDSASVSHSRRIVEIVSSRGVCAAEESTDCSAFLFGMAAEGGEVSSFDYAADEDVRWEELTGRLRQVGRQFAERVVSALGAQPADEFRGYALLSPDVTADLVDAIGFLVSARSVQEGRSRFAGKIGQKVASGVFTLTDQPRTPGRPRSRSFDREGVPTRPLTVIANGVLQGYLYDTRTARKDGVSSTGHAAGGAGGQPSPALHAPQVQATASLSEMEARIVRGVRVRRFSGNINPINGVFSGLVKGGHFIENGVVRFPVTDTMISATLDELLDGIIAVSEETEITGLGPLPWLLVSGVAVIGRKTA